MRRGFPYQERSARVRAASDALTQAAHQRRRAPGGRWDTSHPSYADWEARADAFWSAVRHAVPPGFYEQVDALKHGDVSDLDEIIGFLEADPIYFRSGYLKADIVRWICRVSVDDQQAARLRQVVLSVVAAGWRREFRRYCILARRLASADFKGDLELLARSSREDVRRRAVRALEAIDGKPWRRWRKDQGIS